MEFRILGPTELWSSGRRCDLGPAKTRSGLAILLLTPRTIVPVDALIDRMWDARPPAKARDTLRVYMSRLRASLRDAIGDQVRLTARASGYVLDIDPRTIDLHRFRQLRREAGALLSRSEPSAAVSLLRQADGLWRGQALAGIRGDWVARMRDSLDEERRSALRERIESELELGRHADLVGELHGLLAQYPLDETFIAHQMIALYGSGRPADALTLYRDTRTRLVQEQGAEPGPLLADLQQRMLRRDPGLALAEPVKPVRLIPRAAPELWAANQQADRQGETNALAEKAAGIFQSLGDRHDLAEAMDQVGLACQRSSRSREALAYFREASTLYAATADHHGEAAALGHSAIACWQLGRSADAMAQNKEALALCRQIADRRGEAKSLSNLGKMQLLSGFPKQALDSFHLSLNIFTAIGGVQNQAILYQNIGNVYRCEGSYDQGLEACGRALAIYRAIGDRPDEANLLNDVGAIYLSAECYEEALAHYRQAWECAAELGSAAEQVTAMRGISDARRGSGRQADALAGYHAALELARQISDPYEEAKILEGIAEATLATRKPLEARIVFRQALDIYERLGLPEAETVRIRLETIAPGRGSGARAGPGPGQRLRPRRSAGRAGTTG